MKRIIISLFLLVGLLASSQEATSVNEIVFSVSKQSSSRRDLELYQFVLKEFFQKNKMSIFSKRELEDFLLSRLAYREALNFDLSGVEAKNKSFDAKKQNGYTDVEVKEEVQVLLKALAYMEIKENHLKEQVRFDTWFDLLKRKYQVKYKVKQ